MIQAHLGHGIPWIENPKGFQRKHMMVLWGLGAYAAVPAKAMATSDSLVRLFCFGKHTVTSGTINLETYGPFSCSISGQKRGCNINLQLRMTLPSLAPDRSSLKLSS